MYDRVTYYRWNPKREDTTTCPQCGYCPHCGRSERSYYPQTVPMQPWAPSPLPYQPFLITAENTETFQIFYDDNGYPYVLLDDDSDPTPFLE